MSSKMKHKEQKSTSAMLRGSLTWFRSHSMTGSSAVLEVLGGDNSGGVMMDAVEDAARGEEARGECFNGVLGAEMGTLPVPNGTWVECRLCWGTLGSAGVEL